MGAHPLIVEIDEGRELIGGQGLVWSQRGSTCRHRYWWTERGRGLRYKSGKRCGGGGGRGRTGGGRGGGFRRGDKGARMSEGGLGVEIGVLII